MLYIVDRVFFFSFFLPFSFGSNSHNHLFKLTALLLPCFSLTVLHWRKNCICSSEEFCAEQWFCSSRTHLMPHWNPIITTMEQNELLLTWSAASWFEVAEELARSAARLNIFISFSFCRVHSILPHWSPHQHPPTHIYTHSDFRHAGHYLSQLLWPIRVWQHHLTRQAGLQPLRTNKHLRAVRADGLYWHEVKKKRKSQALQRHRRQW